MRLPLPGVSSVMSPYLAPYLTSYAKVYSIRIEDLNMKNKTMEVYTKIQ